MADFFAMGGYAVYVWSSWGLTLLVMMTTLIQALRRLRALRREVEGDLQIPAKKMRSAASTDASTASDEITIERKLDC